MHYILSFLLAYIPWFVFCQKQALDYSQWRYPEVKIRALQLDNNYSGRVTKFLESGRDFFSNSDASINVNFSILKNSKTIQNNKDYGARVDFSDQHIYYQFSYGQDYRKFFSERDPKGFFYELRPQLNMYYEKREQNVHSKSINGNLGLYLGKGRIEPMRDIFVAQFMLDDMVAENLLDSTYQRDLVVELANIMILTRSQRVFDSRMARKYQLKTICDFLVTKGLASSIEMFNVVNDHWFNTVYNNRSVGEKISFGLASNIEHDYNDNGSRPPTSRKSGLLGLHFDYQNTKPLSQFWHREIKATLSAAQDPASFLSRGYSARCKIEYSYFPTTRTSFNGGVGTYFSTHDFENMVIIAGLEFKTSVFVTNTIRVDGYLYLYRNNDLPKEGKYLVRYNNYFDFFDEFEYLNEQNHLGNRFNFNYAISMGYFFF